MKIYLLSISFVLFAIIAFAQKEANIWYFGMMGAGLDFNSGSPVSTSNDSMNTNEGCASIADKTTGQSLFYTDGTNVYNKNNLVMTNGTGLLGDGSTTQSAVIIPQPGSDSLFYIFTADVQVGIYSGNAGKFCYNVVDISQSAGLGAVILKNQVLTTGMTEKIAAHRHCNGHDIWVVAHQWNSNAFYVYLITNTGFTGPVISHSGTIQKNYGNDPYDEGAIGYMKISPDGSMISLACDLYMHLVEVFPFNNSTGVVGTPIVTDNTWSVSQSSGGPYGITFSPDSRLLYVGVDDGFSVYQYNLKAGNSAAILASKLQVGSPKGAYGAGALQIGPDGKIYIAVTGTYTVAALNNPDTPGMGCNYIDTAVVLSGICEYGLPDMAEISFIPPPLVNTATLTYPTCTGDSTLAFMDSSFNSPASFLWDFGDPSSADSDSSTLQNPLHAFSSSGVFNVKLYISNHCETDTITQTVTASSGINASAFPHDTAFCQGNSVHLHATGGATYSWSPGAGLSDSTIANPIATPDSTTIYTVTAFPHPCGDSSATVSVLIYSSPSTPVITHVQDTVIYCNSDPSYSSYQWSFDTTLIAGATDTLLVVHRSGNYNVEVTNGNGCKIAVGINVVLGIQNYADNNFISLLPDPSSDVITIHSSFLHPPQEMTVSVLNMLGQLVQEEKPSPLPYTKEREFTIDVSHLSAGIYFLQLKTGGGNFVKRFVKE